VAHAVMGESYKIIAYRLGVSRPRVTNALRSAMRKLGVTTDAELVAWRLRHSIRRQDPRSALGSPAEASNLSKHLIPSHSEERHPIRGQVGELGAHGIVYPCS